MKSAHLTPALIATMLIIAVLIGSTQYAEGLENRYVHALAPKAFNQKYVGSALQRAASRQPDLLLIYGSSELDVQKKYQGPYRAINVFRGAPTGFNIFPVGQGDTTDLLILQRLAAIGPGLRGKKVVISLSPTWFFERLQVPHNAYAGNFSRLQAGEVAFSTDLSFDLKHAIAMRMLDYPDTLQRDPVLRFAVEKLADGSLASRALYYLALPLGKLHNLVLRLQDHWEILTYIWSRPDIQPAVPPRGTPPDWSALFARAERSSYRHTDSNPFGFDNQDWRRSYRERVTAKRLSLDDRDFLSQMNRAREWFDLELLLRALQDLGAQPLILSMPMGGSYYDYVGVSARARTEYYARVEQLASRYGAAVRDFADHDEDPHFVLNARGHLLPTGWIYYSRALDDFYHNRPLQ